MSNNIIDKIQLSGITYDIGGQGGSGVSVVEVTQAEYDALPTSAKTDTSKMYVITDAEAGDLTNYYTKTETNTLLGGKQDTLSAGTNISIVDNVISAEGGSGKAVTGGTNISITTGETADTINCTLPIREGSHSSKKGIIVGDSECSSTGLYSISFGHNADAGGSYSLCMGSNSSCNGQQSIVIGDGSSNNGSDFTYCFGSNLHPNRVYQFLEGANLHSNNEYEVAFGQYNVSSRSNYNYGDSGNTLFSIGNGYDFSSTHNWHNALEIRQNGDIYIANTNDTSITGDKAYSLYPMIKLQDTVSATAANTTALGGLKLVKLSQSEYDNLATKDSNTLYIVTDS